MQNKRSTFLDIYFHDSIISPEFCEWKVYQSYKSNYFRGSDLDSCFFLTKIPDIFVSMKRALFIVGPEERILQMIKLADLESEEEIPDLVSVVGELPIKSAKTGFDCDGIELNLSGYNIIFIYEIGYVMKRLEKKPAKS